MNQPGILRWTRKGILKFSWARFESFEKLVMIPGLRDRLVFRTETFLSGEQEYHKLRIPWRYGLFFFGPSGSGKTAAGRGLARRLDWEHLTIPAHEILDSHLLERALFDAVSQSRRVIVLEDVDTILSRMEPKVFFTLLDHAMERAEGTLWVATSRHAEDTPKTQLLRPGRFDESIRMDLPQNELRKILLYQVLNMEQDGSEDSEESAQLLEWVESTQGLSFSHFEELRQLVVRMKIEKREPYEIQSAIESYIENQFIAGDRLGGLSDETELLKERVQQVDPRILMAALNLTDVFRVLIEKVIGDSTEQAKIVESED